MSEIVSAAARRLRYMIRLFNLTPDGSYTFAEAEEVNRDRGLMLGRGDQARRVQLSPGELKEAWDKAYQDAD